MNRRTFLAALIAATVAAASPGDAAADEWPEPLICGLHRITVLHVQGNSMECHLKFGRKAHIQTATCAPRPMRILDGRLLVSAMGEVTGTLDIVDRKKRSKAQVRGYIGFTGNLTLGLQKQGDWQIHGLIGYGRVKPTCAGPTKNIFSEDFDDE
jgi:hypothetical protein